MIASDLFWIISCIDPLIIHKFAPPILSMHVLSNLFEYWLKYPLYICFFTNSCAISGSSPRSNDVGAGIPIGGEFVGAEVYFFFTSWNLLKFFFFPFFFLPNEGFKSASHRTNYLILRKRKPPQSFSTFQLLARSEGTESLAHAQDVHVVHVMALISFQEFS